MRFFVALVVCAVLLTNGAVAETFTFYSPAGELDLPSEKIPVSINLGGRADLDTMANAYTSAIKTNLSATSIAVARNNTVEALERAKSDDVAYIQTSERNMLLAYRECDDALGYTFCFTAITYPEEDGPPLGDRTLGSVKVINGSYQLPVTITAVAQQGKLTATRTLSASSVYPGTPVTATVTLVNTGTAPISGVRIDDVAPAPIAKGESSARTATLGIGESLTAVYTVKPTVPGTYTFNGAIAPSSMASLANSTLIVKEFILVSASIGTATTGKPVPFSLLVQNNYNAVSEVVVTVRGGVLAGTGDNWSHKGPTLLDTRTIKLPVSAILNLSGTVTSTAVASDSLIVEVAYTADENYKQQYTFPYQVREQGLIASPLASIGALDLTLTSDATVRTDGIVIDWGDGTSETIALLQPDRSIALTHKYATTTVSPVTVGVTALIGPKPFNKSFSIEIPGLSGAPLLPIPTQPPVALPAPTTPTAAEPAPTAPAPTAPVAQPPAAPAPLSENGPAGGGYVPRDDGMIRGFLRWFNGLFT